MLAPEFPLQAASRPPRSSYRRGSLSLLLVPPGAPASPDHRLGYRCPRRGRVQAPWCAHGRLRQRPAFYLWGRGGPHHCQMGTGTAAASHRGTRPSAGRALPRELGHAPRTPGHAPDVRAPGTQGAAVTVRWSQCPGGLWAWGPDSHQLSPPGLLAPEGASCRQLHCSPIMLPFASCRFQRLKGVGL